MLHAYQARALLALSHRYLPMAGGDGAIMELQMLPRWSILLTIEKLIKVGNRPSKWAGKTLYSVLGGAGPRATDTR